MGRRSAYRIKVKVKSQKSFSLRLMERFANSVGTIVVPLRWCKSARKMLVRKLPDIKLVLWFSLMCMEYGRSPWCRVAYCGAHSRSGIPLRMFCHWNGIADWKTIALDREGWCEYTIQTVQMFGPEMGCQGQRATGWQVSCTHTTTTSECHLTSPDPFTLKHYHLVRCTSL